MHGEVDGVGCGSGVGLWVDWCRLCSRLRRGVFVCCLVVVSVGVGDGGLCVGEG
jgi:hypothetical protein